MTITEDQNKSIAWAQIIIFAGLALPSILNLCRHGRRGILGWLPINMFCLVRVLGGILTLRDYSTQGHPSISTAIIAGLGVNPLLTAGDGILHEARASRMIAFKKPVERFLTILFHGVAVAAITLITTRGDDLANPHRSPKSQALLDAGFSILFVCWLWLIGMTALSFFQRPGPSVSLNSQQFKGATILLYATAVTLPFSGVRVVYSMAYYFGNSADFAGSLAAKVILDVIPEILFTVIYVLAGLITRNMYAFKELNRAVSMEPYSHRSARV